MSFLDSLDIANRACQLIGVDQIFSPTEDSQRNFEISNAYDKVRRAELRRNTWRFSIRKAALRPLDTTSLILSPAAWDATKTYLPGEVVQDSNAQMWVSEQADNINNTPGGNNEAWDMHFGPRAVHLWDSSTGYYSGELVYVLTGISPYGYQVYLSLISGNTDAPGTSTPWSAATQYKQDDVVSSGISQWRSLLPVNLNNTPADGPAAWAVGTTYSSSQQATGSDNYIYTSSVNGNVGNDPTLDGGVHWTATGTLNAWARLPAMVASSINWRPLHAALKNVPIIYPVGSGPASQSVTRNVFMLPVGFLRKATDSREGSAVVPLGGPSGVGYDDFEFDDKFIVSGCSGVIVLRFSADITKVRAMDDMFCEGLACRIAAATCQRLTQSDAKLQTIASEYQKFMGEARLVNAIEQGSEMPPDDDWLTVRY